MTTRVGSATGTNTATLPSHAAGDLIIVGAFRDGSATPPTVPSSQNWLTRQSTGSNTCSGVLVCKIAVSAAETVGTFTNATSIVALVYRPAAGEFLRLGASGTNGGASTSVNYPAITLEDGDGSSWVGGIAGHRSTNTTVGSTAPTGMTNIGEVNDATDELGFHDTNGGVSSWSSQNASVGGTSSGWRSFVFEIIEGRVTLNPNDKEATASLSNANLTQTSTGDNSGVRATHPIIGKKVFEFTINSSALIQVMGVIGAADAMNDPGVVGCCLMADDGIVWFTGTGGTNQCDLGTPANGDEITVAVDEPNNRVWFSLNGGNWNASGSADPSTNTGGINITSIAGQLYPYLIGSNFAGATSTIFNAGRTAFAKAVPSGFTALDPVTSIAGTASITEASDTVTTASKLAIVAALSKTEASDTLTSATKLAIVGTASKNEASDTLAGVARNPITAASSIIEASDVVTSAGKLNIKAVLNATEASDTSSSAAHIDIHGYANGIEVGDTLISAAKLNLVASANINEVGDTLSAAGNSQVTIYAVAAVQETGDTANAVSKLLIVGIVSKTEAGDTLTCVAAISIKGAANVITEASDTSTAVAHNPIAANASITEASDTSSAASKLAIKAACGATEANDTLNSNAALRIVANFTAVEASDTLFAYGGLELPLLTGVANLTEASDTVTSVAVLPLKSNTSITEASDTLSAVARNPVVAASYIAEVGDYVHSSGLVLIRGGLSVNEASDTVAAIGYNAALIEPVDFLTLKVEAEDRTLRVLKDDTNLSSVLEDRTLRIVADDRTLYIEAENRTLKIRKG
jgi:hypothetical protein